MSDMLTIPASGSLDLPNPSTGTKVQLDVHQEQFRLFVVELSDEVGMRRDPKLPIVRIEITDRNPDTRFAEIKRSTRLRNSEIHNYGLTVRDDLAPLGTWSTRREAKQAKVALAEELKRRGFTVMGFNRTWRLYVIELSDNVGEREHPQYPWVYVGQTSNSIEHRYKQHITGARNKNGRLFNKDVLGHAIGLRPDLYSDESELHSEKDSEDAERALACRLRSIGYSVKGVK